MNVHTERLARNETLFREVNERIEAVAHALGPEIPYEFICECADAECISRISLPVAAYRRVRDDPRQFLILPTHFVPGLEEVVREEESYWVVRKIGEAGKYVEELDRRADPA